MKTIIIEISGYESGKACEDMAEKLMQVCVFVCVVCVCDKRYLQNHFGM